VPGRRRSRRPRTAVCVRYGCKAPRSRITRRPGPRPGGPQSQDFACGSPARTCQPLQARLARSRSRIPPGGFGSVVYRPRSANSSARAMCARSCDVDSSLIHSHHRWRHRAAGAIGPCWVPPPAMSAQLIDFGAECVHILKAAVYGRKTDIPDLVQMAQFLITISPMARESISRSPRLRSPVADSCGGGFSRLTRNGPLFEGLEHSGEQLLLIEGFAAASPLTTVGNSNSAASKVVNLSVHAKHSRACESAVPRRRGESRSP